jgi:hypothetical protein
MDKTLARLAAASETDDDFVKPAPKFVFKYTPCTPDYLMRRAQTSI